MLWEDHDLEIQRSRLERLVEENWPNYQSELVLMASHQMDQAILNYYLTTGKGNLPAGAVANQ